MKSKNLTSVLLFVLGLVLFNLCIFLPFGIFGTVFTALYVSFIPGLLVMSAVKKKFTLSLENFLYTIGLSLSILMSQGLVINWLLPMIGISHPISVIPLSITFSLTTMLLIGMSVKRKATIHFAGKLPKVNIYNGFFLLYSLTLPILATLGAILLNNNGSNSLVLFMLASIAICIFGEVLLHKKIDEKIMSITLLTSGIALLLSTSLRSINLSGHDVITEYHVFELVKSKGYWSFSSFKDAYNACVSITILPAIYDAFLKINDQYIFKVIYQIIFSFTTLIVYVFLRKFMKNVYAFVGAFFYTAQYTFLGDFPFLARQEIATIFFTLAILLLFNFTLSVKFRKILLVIFLISMVLSHYSTSYIAIGFFVTTYISYILVTKFALKRSFLKPLLKNYKKYSKQTKETFLLTPIVIITMVGVAYLWNSQITHTTDYLNSFYQKVIHSGSSIFSSSTRMSQTSIFDQFNLFYQSDPQKQLSAYIQSAEEKYKPYPNLPYYPSSTYVNYHPTYQNLYSVPVSQPKVVVNILDFIQELDKKLIKLFILVGIFYMVFIKKHKSLSDITITVSVVIAQLVLLAFILIPIATVDYSLMRVYQQMLIILAIPSLLGIMFLVRIFPERIKTLILICIFGIYYLSYSQFIPQLIGGDEAKLHLNNDGLYYDEYYTQTQEIIAGKWLKSEYDQQSSIYTDQMTANRLVAFSNFNPDGFGVDVLPEIITKDSYVFSSYTETVKGVIIQFFNGNPVSYNYPTNFLSSNKNLIYNNGGVKIYK